VIARVPHSRTRRIQLVAGLAIPVIGFVVLLRALGNATEALAVTDSIPMLWVLAYALWRRRIEPLSATAATLAATALLLTIALGGSPLPLELHHAVFPGTVGLACLISVAVRRPLLTIALARLTQRREDVAAEHQPELSRRVAPRTLSTLTALIGVTLVTDAATQVALALTLSVATFGVVARIAGHVVVGIGLAICVVYLRWAVRRASGHGPKPTPDSAATPHPMSTAPPSERREIPT
jgi:hypothetical protein